MLYSYLNYIHLLPWFIVFQVLMLADCLLNRSLKGFAKGKWFLVIMLLQGVGGLIYFVFAPSLLLESIISMLVSLRQNATAVQTFIHRQQRKHQPSQPKIQPETLADYNEGYQSQISSPPEIATSSEPSSPPYDSYEIPHASYPTVETINPKQPE